MVSKICNALAYLSIPVGLLSTIGYGSPVFLVSGFLSAILFFFFSVVSEAAEIYISLNKPILEERKYNKSQSDFARKQARAIEEAKRMIEAGEDIEIK